MPTNNVMDMMKKILQFLRPSIYDLPITLWLIGYTILFYTYWDGEKFIVYETFQVALTFIIIALLVRFVVGQHTHRWFLYSVALGVLILPLTALYSMFFPIVE